MALVVTEMVVKLVLGPDGPVERKSRRPIGSKLLPRWMLPGDGATPTISPVVGLIPTIPEFAAVYTSWARAVDTTSKATAAVKTRKTVERTNVFVVASET